MQDKPIRCAYAYATTQPIASNAIYQRGRYYVTDNTGKKDKYRYNIFFADLDGNIHLLGLTGTIDNAKRYTNSMYHAMPMAITLVETQTEQAEKLGKKYRVRLRPEKKEKQVKSPREKAKASPKPKATPKASPKPKAQPKPKAKASPNAKNKFFGDFFLEATRATDNRTPTEEEKNQILLDMAVAKKQKNIRQNDFDQIVGILENPRFKKQSKPTQTRLF